jgi:hypothetical protein
MTGFLEIVASLLFLGGIIWQVVLRSMLLWFARNMHTEAKSVSFLSTRLGKLILWRLRMIGVFAIIVGLIVFFGVINPDLVGHLPGDLVAALLVAPVVVGWILMRLVGIQIRKENRGKADLDFPFGKT